MSILKKQSRVIIFGGLFFIIPLFILLIIWEKLYSVFSPLGEKISNYFGLHFIFGPLSVIIVCIVLLILISFFSGYLIEKGVVKTWSKNVEQQLFIHFPSLQMLKFRLVGGKDKSIDDLWEAIFFKDGEYFRIGFITDTTDKFIVVYVPDAPKIDAGEILYFPKDNIEYYNITMKQAMSTIYSFGTGLPVDDLIKNGRKTN